MQAQGFGRKGGSSGATAYIPPRPAPAARLRPADDPYAALRSDFIAQERSTVTHADTHADTLAWDTPTSGRSWSRSRLVAYLLWFFVGGFAAHRIYCGRYISAALQAMIGVVGFCVMVISPHSIGTWGSLILIQCVWFLFDAFLIPGMCRNPPAAY